MKLDCPLPFEDHEKVSLINSVFFGRPRRRISSERSLADLIGLAFRGSSRLLALGLCGLLA